MNSPHPDPARAAVDTWVNDSNAALLVDLYELRMLQAYWREGLNGEAVFSLYVRELPAMRNYLVACGLADVLRYLETLRFAPAALRLLSAYREFSPDFLQWLEGFRFRGDVYAIPEGTIIFGNEPLIEIVAPLPEAQLIETFVLNQVGFQTVFASKASRVVTAAGAQRAVVDFGMRRMWGTDAAMKSSRAFFIAGVNATSNVLGGALYGVPLAGTMAHSYIQAHADELEAFRKYAALYPDTVLLVDTYDTLAGVRRVVQLARETGSEFRVAGIRLDSGDLIQLAFAAREILDQAGLNSVEIFASGNLDEYAIEKIVASGAPITGFGVGTAMAVSDDAPRLDIVYKLTAYAGAGRVKTSPAKQTHPGRKQVFREERGGHFFRDTIGRAGESLHGEPLLRQVMVNGRILPAGQETPSEARQRMNRQRELLPPQFRSLYPATAGYPVAFSAALDAYRDEIARRLTPAPEPAAPDGAEPVPS
jgi:nicotinate phosphoribosyltransferase